MYFFKLNLLKTKKNTKRKPTHKKTGSKKINYIVIIVIIILILLVIYRPVKHYFFKTVFSKSIDEIRKDLPQYSVFGIDVSVYQEDINWDTVFDNQQIDFVFVRATAGIDNFDKKFKQNWDILHQKNVVCGAYHYYRPDESSEEQAKFFIQNVDLKTGDLPPVLDIEKINKSKNINELKDSLLKCLDIIETHYKITPLLYSYNNFYTTYILQDKRFEKYSVWIAWYDIKGNPQTIVNDWIFWQFTDNGKINGISGSVDVNVFNGNILDINGIRIRK